MTSETSSKKLEFYIDNPETGLKKTYFNIITNYDEIDDMNDNKINCYNDNPTNVVYSWTTNDSLYRLADYELQLNYDLEKLYRTDDWKSTNSHKGKLVIAYYTTVGYKTLHPRVFYALYIGPNDVDNRHLIHRLSTD